MKPTPPKVPLRFFRWYCHPKLQKYIEGDLIEVYGDRVAEIGKRKADLGFFIDVMLLCRPGIIRPLRIYRTKSNGIMLRSYFKIGYRNILKNKGYSFINIFGLSLGIACCLLMLKYVRFETSYDNFHPSLERTFRVDRQFPSGTSGSSAPPLARTLKDNYAEVEEAMRINTPGDFIIRHDDGPGGVLAFNETNIFAADSNFFSFFGFELKEGNPHTALSGANKVVLSQEVAHKLFGNETALGKTLLLGDDRAAIEVTGVTNHQPENTHFHFDYLLSMETNPNVKRRDWSWVWTQVVTYVRLRPDASPQQLEAKLAGMAEKIIKPAFEARGMNYENTRGTWNFILLPMHDIHLRSGDNRLGPVGSIAYVYTFGIIGIFVLIIAAINFINLSTARATRRAREVGVKKSLGASRSSLISQFQAESIMMAIISMLLAIPVAEGLRWMIAELGGIEIQFSIWDEQILLALPVLALFIGFAAGLYPSFYLTSFRPVQVLKGKIAAGMGNVALRNALVIVQFTISIALITGTIIVFQQLRFMGNTDLGFNKENVLLIKYADKLGSHLETFRDEVKTFPGVVNAGITMEVPGGSTWSDDFVREGTEVNVNVSLVKIDENYFETLGFGMAAGRGFEIGRPSDRNAVIINETTAHLFGWTPDQAIGQYLVYPGNENTRHEIIGVMKDFHYQSLQQPIIPVLFCKLDAEIWGDWRTLTVKFTGTDLPALIQRIDNNWNKVLNDTPMDYAFLDQNLEAQYRTEKKLGSLFGFFSGLAILIAVIGLVGLVSYSAEVRKKEIGIRKVFGASPQRIVVMMNSQYTRLIFISLLIATPFSWWAISQWLDSFAFRIEISPLVFVVAGIVQVSLALLSVGYLSLRAASVNPSIVLKEE